MAKKYINDTFWSDNYVERISPDHKLVYLFMITNPLCNLAGVYEITTKRIGFGTGYDPDVIEVILQKFTNDGKIRRINDWIILVNHKKNQAFNTSMLIGLQKIVDALPAHVRAVYDELFANEVIEVEEEETPVAPKKKREKKEVEEVEIELPSWLNKEAWNEWVAYRRDEKKKPMTARAISMQIKELSEYTKEHVKIIQHSIKNDYQGLFPDKFKKDTVLGKTTTALHTGEGNSIVEAMKAKSVKA